MHSHVAHVSLVVVLHRNVENSDVILRKGKKVLFSLKKSWVNITWVLQWIPGITFKHLTNLDGKSYCHVDSRLEISQQQQFSTYCKHLSWENGLSQRVHHVFQTKCGQMFVHLSFCLTLNEMRCWHWNGTKNGSVLKRVVCSKREIQSRLLVSRFVVHLWHF